MTSLPSTNLSAFILENYSDGSKHVPLTINDLNKQKELLCGYSQTHPSEEKYDEVIVIFQNWVDTINKFEDIDSSFIQLQIWCENHLEFFKEKKTLYIEEQHRLKKSKEIGENPDQFIIKEIHESINAFVDPQKNDFEAMEKIITSHLQEKKGNLIIKAFLMFIIENGLFDKWENIVSNMLFWFNCSVTELQNEKFKNVINTLTNEQREILLDYSLF